MIQNLVLRHELIFSIQRSCLQVGLLVEWIYKNQVRHSRRKRRKSQCFHGSIVCEVQIYIFWFHPYLFSIPWPTSKSLLKPTWPCQGNIFLLRKEWNEKNYLKSNNSIRWMYFVVGIRDFLTPMTCNRCKIWVKYL